MDEIVQGKVLVGTVLDALNYSKVYGNLNLRNLYLLDTVGDLIRTFPDLKFEDRQRLETLYNSIKYNDPMICNYNQKDLRSFKGILFCQDCGTESVNNLRLKVNTELPTVDGRTRAIVDNYTFVTEDFTTNFSDPRGNTYETVRIVGLPSIGLLQFNGVNITSGFEFDIAQVANLRYILRNDTAPIMEGIMFQTSNNNDNKLFSNMATFTLNVEAAANQPPSQVGNNARTIANGATYTFTVADFTTATTPPYADPEGDAASMLRITSLPTDGDLQFNSIAVTLNQVIPFQGATSINSGALRYVAEQNSPNSDTEMFTFEISDTGSGQFVG